MATYFGDSQMPALAALIALLAHPCNALRSVTATRPTATSGPGSQRSREQECGVTILRIPGAGRASPASSAESGGGAGSGWRGSTGLQCRPSELQGQPAARARALARM